MRTLMVLSSMNQGNLKLPSCVEGGFFCILGSTHACDLGYLKSGYAAAEVGFSSPYAEFIPLAETQRTTQGSWADGHFRESARDISIKEGCLGLACAFESLNRFKAIGFSSSTGKTERVSQGLVDICSLETTSHIRLGF